MATVEGHRLLVLGSMDEFVGLVKMAKARGYRTFVADGYADGPAKAYADESFDIDIRDTGKLEELGRKLGIDGVVSSYSDILFESACKLTHRLGIYSYCPLDGMAALRDKRKMDRMLAEAGARRPQSRIVYRGAVEEDCRELRFPCVMKPVNGYGSYGIFVVEDARELAVHFQETASVSSEADVVLAQEYDRRPEINMISWVAGGKVHPISLADREKCQLVPGGVPDVVRIVYPSRYAPDAAAPAVDVLQKVAERTGMQDGPLSMQFFWHEDTQEPVVCEVAGRVLGYEHELTEIGAGFSIDEALLDLAYDRDAMRRKVEAHSLDDFSGISFVCNFHAKPGAGGCVGDTSSAERLLSHPGVIPPSMLHYGSGERVGHGKGAKPYLARLFCHVGTRKQADDLTEALFEEFTLPDEDGNELCCAQTLR